MVACLAPANQLAGHAAFPADEHAAEIRFGPRLRYNQFSQERHLVSRDVYKQGRSAALAEWQSLMT